MSLPSRPNARIGLPSGPAPRSRSVNGRATPSDIPSRPGSAASNPPLSRTRTTSSPSAPPARLRPQRSYTALPRADDSRSRSQRNNPPVPPLPPLPKQKKQDERYIPTHPYGERKGSVESISSAASSAVSSTFDSVPGSATSVTSVEDNDEMEKDMKGGDDQRVAPGFGSSLWGRVAIVAGNLTVSVSRAWEANITASSGEVTPPGSESRLTRAMKAYHIEKARHPGDLPEWLFTERERGITTRSARADSRDEPTRKEPPPPPPERQAPPAPNRARTMVRKQVDTEGPATMSRAAQRLREMRDAKRNPKVHFAESVHPRHAASAGQQENGSGPAASRAEAEAYIPSAPEVPVRAARPARGLPSVGPDGKRAAIGLPSGVRPRRT